MTTTYPLTIDSFDTHVDNVDDVMAADVNNLNDAVVALQTAHRDQALMRVKNTSGSTVAANDVGYIDEAGEFKLTTTAYLDAAWAVVVEGAANNSDIIVTNKGLATVVLNANCSIGDYLYTSTTSKQASVLGYVRPEVFAVAKTANAGGVGGTCEALLLTSRRFIGASVNETYFVVGTSDYDFISTIATLPGGAVLTYGAVTSGHENTIEPYNSVDYAYKLVLTNTTRSNDALIQDVVVGTNTITLTANVPGTWQVGDTISARSQIATGTLGGSRYYELDVGTSLNPLATTIVHSVEVFDSGAAAAWTGCGNVVASPATELVRTQVANVYNGLKMHTPIINSRFVMVCDASGVGTMNAVLRQVGYFVAAL